jgi:membrane-associated phospholipid phosphatase
LITDRFRAKETQWLSKIQSVLIRLHFVGFSKGLSFLGEHAAVWLVIASLGMYLTFPNSWPWVVVFITAAVAHALSILIKRLVRRHRPDSPSVQRLGTAPSQLSFPSSHATSTTAAIVVMIAILAPITPCAWLLLTIPLLMALARLTLGMHFPGDVLAGIVLGLIVGIMGIYAL